MYMYMYIFFTLCAYAQQGYAFGRISLYIILWPKTNLFGALPFKKILLSVLYYLLVEFKCLQSGFLRPASCIDEGIYACSIKQA